MSGGPTREDLPSCWDVCSALLEAVHKQSGWWGQKLRLEERASLFWQFSNCVRRYVGTLPHIAEAKWRTF